MNLLWLANRNTLFWTLHLGAWVAWLTTYILVDLYRGGHSDAAFVIWPLSAIVGASLTLLLRYVYRAVWDYSPLLKLPVMLIGSFLLALAWMGFEYYGVLQPYFPDLLHVEKEEGLTFAGYMAGNLGYSYFLFICWSALYFGIKYYLLFQAEQARTLSAMAAANEAQVRMLRYQLNPHFLFNTLNAIATLIDTRENESANRMVSRLSRFLRYSLDKDPMERVDLDHELSALELYLEIERVRFEERLRVVIECDDESRKALIPSLLLQPLVENSIKYAVAGSEEGGTITIGARVFGGDLLLEFSDDGPGMITDEESMAAHRGVGLHNIRERLAQVYGESHACSFGNVEPQGLKVSIRVPYEVS